MRIHLRILHPYLKTRFDEVTTQITCAVGVHFYEWLKIERCTFHITKYQVPVTFDFVLAFSSSS